MASAQNAPHGLHPRLKSRQNLCQYWYHYLHQCLCHYSCLIVRRAVRMAAPFLLLCCLMLPGCLESRMPEGVVAVVNNEHIYLRTVQALLDSRSAALGTLQRPSLESLKQSYGEALGSLIVHALVRQELERLHIPVSDAAVEQAVDVVRTDYGGSENLSRFLDDESLEENEWRLLVRDHLAMLAFEKRVLLPSIQVALPEVLAYYEQHAAAFTLPERYAACFAAGQERISLETYCADFPDGRANAVEGNPVQCAEVEKEALPPVLRKEAAALKAGTCGAIRRENNMFRVFALVEALPVATASVADVYPLIENALLEQKKRDAFDIWLEGALARADVQVSPHIKDDLLMPPSERQVAASGAAGDNFPDTDLHESGLDGSEGESRSDEARPAGAKPSAKAGIQVGTKSGAKSATKSGAQPDAGSGPKGEAADGTKSP